MRRMVRTGLWLMIAVIGILIIVAAMFAVLPVRPGPSPDKPLVAPFTLQQ